MKSDGTCFLIRETLLKGFSYEQLTCHSLPHRQSVRHLRLGLTFALAVHLFIQAQESTEPHTATAVGADDEGCLKAEITGDTNYVNALL
jgi:hypothetical protein